MSAFSRNFATLLVTGLLCVFLASSAAAQKGGIRKPVKKKQNKQEQATPAYTPAPLQPVPLDQVPAVAPRVQYSQGELTIVAHNSTLSDVLKAVKQQTGADLEIPPNATERVVADVGPGPARDVLAELLNGTHFNYVMVGSATDPTAVQSIVLTAKSGSPDTSSAANHSPAPHSIPGASAVPGTPVDATPPMDNDADDAENSEEPVDQGDQQGQQNAAQPNPNQQTPKTPEELLQELQRQQQQQQKPPAGQPQGILPNQPPTAAPVNPNRPD